jgi:aquaporin Z
MGMTNRLSAELLGIFVLTFGGCGSAVLAAAWHLDQGPLLGIGFAGVAFAFGLTVLTMRFSRLGHPVVRRLAAEGYEFKRMQVSSELSAEDLAGVLMLFYNVEGG